MTSDISLSKKLEAHLTLIRATYPEVLALIAFSPEGLVITSEIQAGQDKEQISALSAMLLKDAMKATDSFEFGKFKRILLVSEKGYITVLNATDEIKIAMLCPEQNVFIKAFNELVKIARVLQS